MNKAISILIAISLSGCLSQNKLAKVCAERFPIKEEIKEVIVVDTIIEKGEIITMGCKDSSFTFICPPSKTITKIKEVKITAENTAKTHLIKQDHQKEINKLNDDCDKQVKSINAELKKKTKEIDKLSEKLESVKKFKHRFYILLSGIILYFVIRLGIKRLITI